MHLGDCLEVLKTFPENSIDSVVTDPPYGLALMGKKWDYDVPSVDIWKEVFRVLKPGGHLLSFGGTRTYHRMVVNIEDAGFEIRDQIQWLYGSGFPKSHDVSKGIDKQAGAERTETFIREDFAKRSNKTEQRASQVPCGEKGLYTLPSTDQAKQWQGWGTALKPANEPICLARKPLEKGLTIAENVLKYSAGALNIDASRVSNSGYSLGDKNKSIAFGINGLIEEQPRCDGAQGRWPANLILDEDAAQMLDEQSGTLKTNHGKIKSTLKKNIGYGGYARIEQKIQSSAGGASRFFYVAKASKRERNVGLDGVVPKEKQGNRPNSADPSGKFPDHDHRPSGANNHPTVKPIKLMEYLCKLITPPQGTILDPFMGSGSTGIAAKKLGFEFIGIEMNEEYLEIAKKRIGED